MRLANAGDLARAVEAFLTWDRPGAILTRCQGERDQAALAAYGTVYARRGDSVPVPVPTSLAPVVPAETWWLRLRDAIRRNRPKDL